MSESRADRTLPAHADVELAIRDGELGVSAAELHGGLCGWLAGGGALDGWLARVLADPAQAEPPSGGALDQLARVTAARFEDRDFGLDLLLPETDASLQVRSDGLFDWCRGFLGGFGLSAGKSPPLSEESAEALQDLARLAAATGQEEGDEEDEQALVEIEEFVRVAALLLHGDCVLGPRHRGRLH